MTHDDELDAALTAYRNAQCPNGVVDFEDIIAVLEFKTELDRLND
ncbi:MAG: hypothetical protein QM634_15930 [Gordonia sp. (in: high G+C Gram-positive bacteria)]